MYKWFWVIKCQISAKKINKIINSDFPCKCICSMTHHLSYYYDTDALNIYCNNVYFISCIAPQL